MPIRLEMFDVQTCPDCDGILPPGASRCAECSQPAPEAGDPWSLGTGEAVATATATAVAPAPGSVLSDPPPKPAKKSGLSTGAKVAIGIVIALVVLVVVGAALVFGAAWFMADSIADSFEEGIVTADGLDEFVISPGYSGASFAVGECFSLDGGDVPLYRDCGQPHGYEVYHVFEASGDERPNGLAAFDLDEVCYTAFASFVGVDYFDSGLFSDTLLPTETEWAAGERTVACSLYEPFEEITGSERGSGR